MAPTCSPEWRQSCTKLSMVKINWNDGDDEFFGVRKLNSLDESRSVTAP